MRIYICIFISSKLRVALVAYVRALVDRFTTAEYAQPAKKAS